MSNVENLSGPRVNTVNNRLMSTFSKDELVLLATLHKVGAGVRLASDDKLTSIIGAAAEKYPAYKTFVLHPVYHESRRLSELLQMLDEGASIVRENASVGYFKISTSVAGTLGRSVIEELEQSDPATLDSIEKVANELKLAFDPKTSSRV